MTDIRFKKYFFVCLFVLGATIAISQPNENIRKLRPSQLKSYAKNAVRIGDIYSAIEYYESYLDIKETDYKSKFQLAELYRASRDYSKAKALYKEVYREDPEKFTVALFYYGLMQKVSGEYLEAQKSFVTFKKEYKGAKDERYYKKLVKLETAACAKAPLIIEDELRILINHLDTSINKAHVELSPISIDKNTLLYASLKADSIEYYNADDSTEVLPVRKFYVAKGGGTSWTGGEEFEGPFNTDETNTCNGAFSTDGNRFYFTRTEPGTHHKVLSRLYVSKKVNGEWQEPVRLPESINGLNYSATQPTIGVISDTKQEVIYFVSDNPKGKGGLDIWYTTYNERKNKYKKPRNAGTSINTILDEMSPFYDLDTRRLYFSSKGWPGIGGYDIFKSNGETKMWSDPENIGYPLNSSVDDIYYSVSKDRERGFFVSNREGGIALKNPTCCDDIYTFRWTEYIHIAINGFIYEDIEKADSTLTDTVFSVAIVNDTIGGYFTDSLNISVDTTLIELTDNPIIFDTTLIEPIDTLITLLDTIATDTLVVDSLTELITPKEDDLEILSGELPKEGEYSLISDAYISLYLIDIKTQLPQYIRKIPSDSIGDYFYDLEQGNDYKIIVEKDGYFNSHFTFSTKNITNSDTLFQPVKLKQIPQEPMVLENIYYEFDKADLTEAAKATIDTTLFVILSDNPDLIVEISSHTDSKGNDDYNMRLSQKRAESVVNYLIDKEIEKDRLVPKGYGETLPVAPNENQDGSDNPEGRQANRRTEFKVIGSSNQFSSLNKESFIIKKKDIEEEEEEDIDEEEETDDETEDN